MHSPVTVTQVNSDMILLGWCVHRSRRAGALVIPFVPQARRREPNCGRPARRRLRVCLVPPARAWAANVEDVRRFRTAIALRKRASAWSVRQETSASDEQQVPAGTESAPSRVLQWWGRAAATLAGAAFVEEAHCILRPRRLAESSATDLGRRSPTLARGGRSNPLSRGVDEADQMALGVAEMGDHGSRPRNLVRGRPRTLVCFGWWRPWICVPIHRA
jgi:hypothetical protein